MTIKQITTSVVRISSLSLLLCLMMSSPLAGANITPVQQVERLTDLQKALDAQLKTVATLLDEKKPVNTRDLSNGALALILRSPKDTSQAEAWLTLVLDSQNMDPASPDYGAIPWRIGSDKVRDENATEFATESWGTLLLRHGGLLSSSFRSKMLAHVPAAIAALKRHTSDSNPKKVEVNYTNIYLLNSSNLLLLGAAIKDTPTIQQAALQFRNWLRHVSTFGIHEYDSPTYYGVDLKALEIAYSNTLDPALRKTLKLSLDYLWTDIAANYFPGRMSLSGPHSRDYDFLTGRGSVGMNLWIEGWSEKSNTKKADLQTVVLLEALSSPSAYHPNESIIKIAELPEKLVSTTWGKEKEDGGDRWNYVTPGFAVGSSSEDFGPQDKPIVWELRNSADEPVISLIPDVTDNPYGKLKTEEKDGHSKPHHVPLHPTTVQDRGAMLVMLDLNPEHEEETASFATNLILPQNADAVFWNGKKTSLTAPNEIPGDVGSILAIRKGGACVGFRIFEAAGADGHSPRIVLKTDSDGAKEHASRLAIYHYQGKAQKLESKHVRVGIASVIRNCKTDGDETDLKRLIDSLSSSDIRSELSRDLNLHNQIWSASVRLAGHPVLMAVRNMTERKTLDRKIGGKPVKAGHLSINGKEMFPDLAKTAK